METCSRGFNVTPSRISFNRKHVIYQHVNTTGSSSHYVKLKPSSLYGRNEQSYATISAMLQNIMHVRVRQYARLNTSSTSDLLITLRHIHTADTDILYKHLPRLPL